MSNDNDQDAERRATRRTGLASQVEIQVASGGEETPQPGASGEMVNVSVGGVLARIDVDLAEGTPCVVRFLEPETEASTFEARGLVRSSRRSGDDVLVGIEFEAPIESVRPPQGADSAAESGFESVRVLVVDDEPSIVELLYRFLTRRGCHVSTASNGVEALAALRAEPHDITVLDLKMPGMDGLQVLEAIRAEGLEAGRVWAISGYATDAEAREALRLGAADFINKPLDLKYLEWSMHLHQAVS